MSHVLSIQDLSCVGRCSLTVALPVLSAMGHQCSVLPTAVLSTHMALISVSDLVCSVSFTSCSKSLMPFHSDSGSTTKEGTAVIDESCAIRTENNQGKQFTTLWLVSD